MEHSRRKSKRNGGRRRAVRAATLLAVALVWGCASVASATTPTATPSCTEAVPAELSFHFEATPAAPVVGQTVDVTITVGASGVAGLPMYVLSGFGPFYETDVWQITRSGPLPDTVVFHLRAVQTGTARLKLSVEYETSVGGCRDFPVWGYLWAYSPEFELTVTDAAGSTETPTLTPTPTETAEGTITTSTPRRGGGGGCRIGSPSNNGGGPGVALTFAALVLLRSWSRRNGGGPHV